jgi:hypothetical protein
MTWRREISSIYRDSELLPLGRRAGSQSLYRLRYPGSQMPGYKLKLGHDRFLAQPSKFIWRYITRAPGSVIKQAIKQVSRPNDYAVLKGVLISLIAGVTVQPLPPETALLSARQTGQPSCSQYWSSQFLHPLRVLSCVVTYLWEPGWPLPALLLSYLQTALQET